MPEQVEETPPRREAFAAAIRSCNISQMQKVAAYLLQRRDGMSSDDARVAEVARCELAILEWLRKKGAETPGAEFGHYDAEDGSHATFRWDKAADETRSWQLVQLDETSSDGTRFSAAVSLTNTGSMVAVYVSLEAGLAVSAVAPVPLDPRCPRLIRSLLTLSGDWYHGATKILPTRRLVGTEGGEWLAQEIRDTSRTLPVAVISEDFDEPLLPYLQERLSYDLTGLANVFVVDADAAWAITDVLGRSLSVFQGGVRLYWPRFRLNDDPYRHPLWSSQRLLSNSEDLIETREMLRRRMRGMVMQASAQSTLRPREIDSIRTNSAKRNLDELRSKAVAGADFERLASDYAADNDRLIEELRQLREELEEKDDELSDLRVRLDNAQAIAPYIHEALQPALEPVGPADPDEGQAPKPGEVRYYKKKYSKDKFDIFVRVNDCGHGNWESAHAADKARKGINRLEGRNDWSKMNHCASCTGGGMWRVTW